ncbi:beta-galactosidase [Tengunoibacter tsumagoiensis]|uniref:Beta-galactosidase n=1 Tax=Tengunoibacter tsumagoiensis TaxID=2014871 RepID=A0A401ZZA7_9CHLR|nr:beta-galactosidase [Tengunoibacter tsumagoiensis]GCE12176.1 beta-galactosidase [Tengunoibacter tsumagoiensis]
MTQISDQTKRDLRAFPSRLPAFYFGADYNPDQWTPEWGYQDEQIWLEDIRMMKLAHVNVVTIGVFSWVGLQPAEEIVNFAWLDRILDLLAQNEIFVCLATPTAAIPAWLAARYPEVLPVDAQGIRRGHGSRQNYCPTSPVFRRLAANLVRQLAERYGNHPALLNWHISNEYYGSATEGKDPCYCERCQARFRQWLQTRHGSLEQLNRDWMTAFWGHTYTDWEQVTMPGPYTDQGVQGQMVDFLTFVSDMYLECYLNEQEILREITPEIPITTNFLGVFRRLDLSRWAPHLDVMSYDSYPARTTHPADIAFQHDVMRSLKGGQPFILMEQTPSQVQWMAQNPLKRPGVMRLLSYQAIAHGANAIQYFQWRQSRGSSEMFHGAIVAHAGHEHTRVFQEITKLGTELGALSTGPGKGLLEARNLARVALLFSWSNWWNVEFRPGPSDQIRYMDEVLQYYRALWKENIAVDIISPDTDLTPYKLVVAPLMNMVSAEQGAAIEAYVANGGLFVTSYFSGVVNEKTLAWLGGYPGPLRKTLGIWVEEYDPLEPDMANTIVVPEGSPLAAGRYSARLWCDLLHLEGARALASFGEDFYAGYPAITEHQFGKGRAFYVATRPEEALLSSLLTSLRNDLQLAHPIISATEGIELVQRTGAGSGSYTFVLNHSTNAAHVTLSEPMYDVVSSTLYEGRVEVPAKEVLILRELSHENLPVNP